jgi:hypothetical protein
MEQLALFTVESPASAVVTHEYLPMTFEEIRAYNVIEAAVQKYKLDVVYALLSGGHDSLTSSYIASRHPKFGGVIHADTRTGPIAHQVTQFVIRTCEGYGWRLIKKVPFTDYQMMVGRYGFPGSQAHQFMYTYLKGRQFAEGKKDAMRFYRQENKLDNKYKPKVGFVTGKRRLESDVRANTPPMRKTIILTSGFPLSMTGRRMIVSGSWNITASTRIRLKRYWASVANAGAAAMLLQANGAYQRTCLLTRKNGWKSWKPLSEPDANFRSLRLALVFGNLMK